MATTLLNTPPTFKTSTAYLSSAAAKSAGSSLKFINLPSVSFKSIRLQVIRNHQSSYNSSIIQRRFCKKLFCLAANGETAEAEAETETQEIDPAEESDSELEIENLDGAIGVDSSETDDTVEVAGSAIVASLNLYKEALANNDEEKVAEVESFLKSIEDEKTDLESKVAALTEELSTERTRILRISADFDNFRKRTDRERVSLVSNAQGEVAEKLLGVLDNFERAKMQIKVATEGEEKISNSYQSIYKQFVEILTSLGVFHVETVGKPFDPMLHEAIMREDSAEYEEGVIIEEYRKGFQLGERLLRPSMVKVSAGPGPAKPTETTSGEEEEKDQQEEVVTETTEASEQ